MHAADRNDDIVRLDAMELGDLRTEGRVSRRSPVAEQELRQLPLLGRIEDIGVLVTDSSIDAGILENLQRRGVCVMLADE